MPGQSAYNAAKFAVRGFTEALREEMIVALLDLNRLEAGRLPIENAPVVIAATYSGWRNSGTPPRDPH